MVYLVYILTNTQEYGKVVSGLQIKWPVSGLFTWWLHQRDGIWERPCSRAWARTSCLWVTVAEKDSLSHLCLAFSWRESLCISLYLLFQKLIRELILQAQGETTKELFPFALENAEEAVKERGTAGAVLPPCPAPDLPSPLDIRANLGYLRIGSSQQLSLIPVGYRARTS